MLQSSYGNFQGKLHAAIIMDGNGRWATRRGLPRIAGHRAGADAVRRAVEAAPALGIGILTLFAFSSDNWRRPADEVEALMHLFERYLHSQASECVEKGVKLEIIGRRDRLSPALVSAIESAEQATAGGRRLWLRLAVDYSGRDAILRAARSDGAAPGALGPDVDLLIRTGGEQRLSDFLLWECAYAELIFSKRMWPEFEGADLEMAVREFHSRERRFGGLPAPAGRHSALSPGAEAWLD